ncbi:PLD nuclease N-terminal domain-containing protein [Nesterenkonia jeotgali]|uniref:Cardiolipin synthase N-terminal domain-containing protein n=1 Tax=Nesterenkonia jeotgali TaxID=317018 RepID=A0A0W8II80_9MICC|nr:PLD nuclease N-terminal domain-containing protein [Nesterenkonia jeotgali]KUG59726.1 hypothetical protein AVL63_11565 [Nesterenkonia jeotgali]
MNPPVSAVVARLLAQSNPVWSWALGVAAVGLLVAALMVLLQEPRPRGRRVAIWAVLILALPILGPATYLIVETIRYRRDHGRPEKSLVEKYAPEEAAQRREQARREGSRLEEDRLEEDRRATERGDDRGAAAD